MLFTPPKGSGFLKWDELENMFSKLESLSIPEKMILEVDR
jgi:hypothetical protein